MMRTESTPSLYGFWGMLWRLGLASGLVFATTVGGAYLATQRLIDRPEAKAPNLLALDELEALKKASREGFPVLVDGYEASNVLEGGQILSQRPQPGMWVKEGSPIRVTVATAP